MCSMLFPNSGTMPSRYAISSRGRTIDRRSSRSRGMRVGCSRCVRRMCAHMNTQTVQMIHGVYGLLYAITGKSRFLLMKVIHLYNALVITRLLWMMKCDPTVGNRNCLCVWTTTHLQLRSKLDSGELTCGCLESWLVRRLAAEHDDHGNPVPPPDPLTEPSLACVTGFYDPYERDWARFAMRHVFHISTDALPTITDTCAPFAVIDRRWFGARIPITAIVRACARAFTRTDG